MFRPFLIFAQDLQYDGRLSPPAYNQMTAAGQRSWKHYQIQSSHTQTTKALCLNYTNIQESLRKIADDTNQQLTTRDEVDKLEINSFEATAKQMFQTVSAVYKSTVKL